MNTQLKAHLEKKIQEWVERHSEDDEWPRAYMGEETVVLMVAAAASVFDAVVESQDYTLHEGYFKET